MHAETGSHIVAVLELSQQAVNERCILSTITLLPLLECHAEITPERTLQRRLAVRGGNGFTIDGVGLAHNHIRRREQGRRSIGTTEQTYRRGDNRARVAILAATVALCEGVTAIHNMAPPPRRTR